MKQSQSDMIDIIIKKHEDLYWNEKLDLPYSFNSFKLSLAQDVEIGWKQHNMRSFQANISPAQDIFGIKNFVNKYKKKSRTSLMFQKENKLGMTLTVQINSDKRCGSIALNCDILFYQSLDKKESYPYRFSVFAYPEGKREKILYCLYNLKYMLDYFETIVVKEIMKTCRTEPFEAAQLEFYITEIKPKKRTQDDVVNAIMEKHMNLYWNEKLDLPYQFNSFPLKSVKNLWPGYKKMRVWNIPINISLAKDIFGVRQSGKKYEGETSRTFLTFQKENALGMTLRVQLDSLKRFNRITLDCSIWFHDALDDDEDYNYTFLIYAYPEEKKENISLCLYNLKYMSDYFEAVVTKEIADTCRTEPFTDSQLKFEFVNYVESGKE